MRRRRTGHYKVNIFSVFPLYTIAAMMEVRKVQQVGYSTLIVSLPREWVKEIGLKQGDTVSISREDDGTLRLYPGLAKEEKRAVRCVVDADKCGGEGILTRVITGIYIIGHDTIVISAKKELSQEHLSEIRKTVQRLTGISVVEQTLNHVTIQNFVDPTRFPVDGLLRRLYIIASSMQDAAIRGLEEGRKELINEAIHMENEVDRIYWLVVRQLLLATRDRSVGKKIGVDSQLHVVGNRTVAKVLENIGDYSENLAREGLRLLELDSIPDKEMLNGVTSLFKSVRGVQDQTMQAFFTRDLRQSNAAIESIRKVEQEEAKNIEAIFERIQGLSAARKGDGTLAMKITAYLALRAIFFSLGQIARYCGTIAEITINRNVEEPSDFCKFEKV